METQTHIGISLSANGFFLVERLSEADNGFTELVKGVMGAVKQLTPQISVFGAQDAASKDTAFAPTKTFALTLEQLTELLKAMQGTANIEATGLELLSVPKSGEEKFADFCKTLCDMEFYVNQFPNLAKEDIADLMQRFENLKQKINFSQQTQRPQ